MNKLGIGRDSPVKASVHHAQLVTGIHRKLPGRPVGIIAVEPKKTQEYNPLVLTFTVSPYRNDFKYIVMQSRAEDCLSGYAKELFDSCFKSW